MATMLVTNAGLNLLRDATIGANNANPLVQYIAIGTGCATLSSGLSNGTPYTSLPVNALAANVAAGQSLTIISGTNTDVVTVASGGASQGATSIPINSWTPSYSFPTGSGLVNTPSLSDTQLEAETYRATPSSMIPGANPGEGVVSMYIYGTSLSGSATTFLEVGMFAGAATSSPNSGTLVARGIIDWNYANNLSNSQVTFDYTLIAQ